MEEGGVCRPPRGHGRSFVPRPGITISQDCLVSTSPRQKCWGVPCLPGAPVEETMPCAPPKPCVPKVEKTLGVLAAVSNFLTPTECGAWNVAYGSHRVSGGAGSAWSRAGGRF